MNTSKAGMFNTQLANKTASHEFGRMLKARTAVDFSGTPHDNNMRLLRLGNMRRSEEIYAREHLGDFTTQKEGS